MNKLLVYYARPLSLYNTEQERRDLDLIGRMGFDVLDPNGPEHQEGYEREGMDYFVGLVHKCDGLVFRSFPFGQIPAGVAKEIAAAEEVKNFVIELPSMIGPRILSVDDTRACLKQSGQR
jgi:hypothetical protein